MITLTIQPCNEDIGSFDLELPVINKSLFEIYAKHINYKDIKIIQSTPDLFLVNNTYSIAELKCLIEIFDTADKYEINNVLFLLYIDCDVFDILKHNKWQDVVSYESIRDAANEYIDSILIETNIGQEQHDSICCFIDYCAVEKYLIDSGEFVCDIKGLPGAYCYFY